MNVAKRKLEDLAEGDDPKKQMNVRRQVEYYFSDDNLKRDNFFNSLMKAGEDNWIEIKSILQCPRIKSAGLTEEEILEELKESHLETKKAEGMPTMIRRAEPIPELQQKQKNKSQAPLHSGGCVVKLTGLPEELSFGKIKSALSDLIGSKSMVRHVSNFVDGVAHALLKPFDGDITFFNDKSFELDGNNVKVELAEEAAGRNFVNTMPPKLQGERTKVIRTASEAKQKTPFTLGGVQFNTADHLRKCVRTLLDKGKLSELLEEDKPAYKVLHALLQFHPEKDAKLANYMGMKIDLYQKSDKADQDSRAFFVVHNDGTSDSFAPTKCINGFLKSEEFEKARKEASSVKSKVEEKAEQAQEGGDSKEETKDEEEGETKEDDGEE